jgi:predicted CXXCH cytochrome family protein
MNRVPAGYTIPVEWPLAGGALSCVTCHMPGHVPGAVPGRPAEPTATRHLLRGGAPGSRNAVCFLCHDKNQWSGRNPHQEAANTEKGCTLCHLTQPVPGKDRAEAVNFVADVNIICLACHDSLDHPGGTQHTVTLTPEMPKVPPTMPLGKGRRITCVTCHTPHVDPATGHYLRATEEPTAFCLSCHKL